MAENPWLSVLQTFGLGTLILVFLGLCLWRVVPWLGEQVIKPWADKYVQLLDGLIVNLERQESLRTALIEMMLKQTSATAKLEEAIAYNVATQKDLRTGLLDIMTRQADATDRLTAALVRIAEGRGGQP